MKNWAKQHIVIDSYKLSREPLLKEKGKYSWPPYTCFKNLLCYCKRLFVLYKTSKLIVEVTCTKPSPSASVLWSTIQSGFITR